MKSVCATVWWILAVAIGGVVAVVPVAKGSAQATVPDETDLLFIRSMAELGLAAELDQWALTLDSDRAESSAAPLELARSRLALMAASGAARPAMMLRLMEAHERFLRADLSARVRAGAMIDRLDDVLRLWLEGEGLLVEAMVGWPAPQDRERLTDALDHLRSALSDAEVTLDRAAREGIRTDDQATAQIALARLVLAALPGTGAGASQIVADEQLRAMRRADNRTLDLVRLLEARSALDRGDFKTAAGIAERVREEPSARPLDRLAAALLSLEASVAGAGEGPIGGPAGLHARIAEISTQHAEAVGAYGRMLCMSAALRIGVRAAESVSGAARTQRYAAMAEGVDRALRDGDAREQAAIRALLRVRLDAALPPQIDRRMLPAFARIAEGERLARDGRMEEAVAVLSELREPRSMEAGDAQAAAALLMQGYLLLGRPVDALRSVDALLGAGGEVLERAAFVDQAARVAHAHGEILDGERDGAALQVRAFDRRIAAATADDDRDSWRLIAAEQAVRSGAFDRAGTLLREVKSGGLLRVRALEQQVGLLQRRAESGGGRDAGQQLRLVRTARDAADDAASAIADERERLELLRIGQRLVLREAELRLELEGGDSALRTLEAIKDPALLSPALRGELLRLRVAALRAAGREGDAEDDLASLLAEADPGSSSDRAERVLLDMLTDAVRRVRAAEREEGPAAAERIAERDIAPLARLAAARVDPADAPLPERVLVAEALRRCGELDEALDRLEWLEREHPDAAEVLFHLAEVLHARAQAGRGDSEAQRARAMTMYRRLVASGPREEGDAVYWTAQLRMLQITEHAGERSQQIALRIRRLRAQDAALGGPALRRAFEQLEARALTRSD